MLSGTVAGVSGSQIRIKTGDNEETTVAIDKPTTKINVVPTDGKPEDAKPGKVADIANGDGIKAYGDPSRCHTVTVTKGDAKSIREASEFNARRTAQTVPATVQVKAPGKDEIVSLPPAAIAVPDQAPADVPYGERRVWREEQAKAAAKESGVKTVE